MAAAKGKRPASKSGARKTSGGKGGAKGRKPASQQNAVFSSGVVGLIVLGIGILLFFCLFTTSISPALVFIRSFINGLFGNTRFFALLLVCILGLQIAFGERWPVRHSALVIGALLVVSLATLFQVFRLDDLLFELKSSGYKQNFNGFLWASYEKSKNIPLGGGFVGALLGYPLGKYLDIIGSALLLFFIMGVELVLLIRVIFPGAGEQMGGWFAQFRDDWLDRRDGRREEKEVRREAALRAQQADKSLLVQLPDELFEQDDEEYPEEEVPPVKAVRGRRPAAAPAATQQRQAQASRRAEYDAPAAQGRQPAQTARRNEYPPQQAPQGRQTAQAARRVDYDAQYDAQYDTQVEEPATQGKQPTQNRQPAQVRQPAQPARRPEYAAPPAAQNRQPAAQKPGYKPTLFIEDILPDGGTPASDAYTQEDAERIKHRSRPSRKDPDILPDFIAKRRAQYDAAYGAFGSAPVARPAPETAPEDMAEPQTAYVEEPPYDDAYPGAYPEEEQPDGTPWEPDAAYYPAMDGDAGVEPPVYSDAPIPAEAFPARSAAPSANVWEEDDDGAPWESLDPVYEPGAVPQPVRRPRMESPLDYQPKLDPETRLDRPDWKPPEEPVPVIAPVAEIEEYRQPPFSLLIREEGDTRKDTRAQDAAGAQKLEETLASFGVDARVIKVVHGPAITRYELQPAPGVKVSKIVNLTDDIALNMAAIGVRIEAPIPGKAAIGIELANDEIETVHLRDVLEGDESLKHPSRLAVALGKDIAGKRIIADLARMPHLLIAGATGSGKSVCINTLITSIIYRATPEEVRLILVDPKKVELGMYNGIPHLLVPVVTDPKKASGALSWAVMEMDERYKVFADVGVRDIRGYNAQRGPDTPLMPQIVIIIDELSDLMLVAPGEVEESICRIAQLARACGIHLVIATQRPSVNVITGIIKANVPSRIAFAVSSQVDSRTILDGAGAEKLLGRGDMLFAPAGGGKPLRVQGCFVSDEEVSRVVGYVKERHTTDYSQAVIDALANTDEEQEAPDEDTNDMAGDALFQQAVEMAVESGQASISMLQRRLRVGYARAGRLIDEMARRNIIGQAEGAKPREVLITREDMMLLFKR